MCPVTGDNRSRQTATMLLDIARQFAKGQAISDIKPLGNGLINDTFLVSSGSFSFILQRINRRVFPEPEQIMANLMTMARHIQQKKRQSISLQIPDIITTPSGGAHFQDQQGEIWRALSYIANTESLETLRGLGDARQVGFALGQFHLLVSDLDPALMQDTLPGFHVTPAYLGRYRQVLTQAMQAPITEESRYCSDFIASHERIADDLESAKRQGLLRSRIIHGDPKLNNFLFDKTSKKIVSIIDLDTVKPGLLHYDIGDCLRSCCLVAETADFDLETGAAILESYLAEVGTFFSEQDYRYLYPAIRLIPFELGLRFYTDYLEGDRYFKVTAPGQNLQRAVEQFRLCESIIAQEFAIKSMIERILPDDKTT